MDNLSLDQTFGAMLIGAILGAIVYGVTTLQTYFYFLNYAHDTLDLKIIVSCVWILDTLHVAFVSHCIYHYLVVGYAAPEFLLLGTWSLFASIAVNVTIAFISHCFFTKRIHDLGPPRFRILTFTILVIVIAHFVFGIETVVQFSIRKEFSRLNEAENVAVVPFGITAVLSDIMIAAALVILLRKSRSEFEDTNSLINKLIVYAVNRCILTSLVAVIEMILFFIAPHSLYAFAIDFVIGKLYANSLLASLNSRQALHKVKKESGRRSSVMSTGFSVASMSAGSRGDRGSLSVIQMSRIESQSSENPISNSRKVWPTSASGSINSHKRRRSLPTMNA